ncbi:MAG: hypothetical protein DIU64_001275 [Caldicoprobacter oshimai]
MFIVSGLYTAWLMEFHRFIENLPLLPLCISEASTLIVMKRRNSGSGFMGGVKKPGIFFGTFGKFLVAEFVGASGVGLAATDGRSCGALRYGCPILWAVCLEGTGVKGYLFSIEFLLAFCTVLYRRCQYQKYKEEKQVIYLKMYIPYKRQYHEEKQHIGTFETAFEHFL